MSPLLHRQTEDGGLRWPCGPLQQKVYATFPPQRARQLAERLEIHYTPKHGSWLNIAEIELSALGRQCIAKNRIPDLQTLRSLLVPWASSRNSAQKSIDWHFTTDDARTKLKHLYPVVKF